jgi:uncharacterized protein (DUF1800 family)
MSTTTAADVAHLWRRAAFGISPHQAERRAGRPWETLVAELVDPPAAPMPRPPLIDDPNAGEWERVYQVIDMWIDHMATTTTPGAEKLTWFWHNHFTSSADKVGWGWDIYRQLALLRGHAQGGFRDLMATITLDGAMIFYLDNDQNTVWSVNENFARELLELFTIGIGHYSQSDVRAVARSFTGWNLDWEGGRYPMFFPGRHDNGTKRVLAHSGNWNANDIFNILCNSTHRPQIARHVVRRLWEQWAYPDPSDALVDALATAVLADGFTGRSFARSVLLHPEFRSTRARQAHVRTPLEIAVALMKATRLTADDLSVQWTLRNAGHCPYFPPNVSGWPSSRALLTTSTWWQLGDLHDRTAWHAAQQTPLLMPDTRAFAPADAAARMLRYANITAPSNALIAEIASVISTLRPATGSDAERAGAHLAVTLHGAFARA